MFWKNTNTEKAENSVKEALQVFMDHLNSSQDDILNQLVAAGFSDIDAWQHYQFLPIGFFHAVFVPLGVHVPSTYILMDIQTGKRQRKSLTKEVLFNTRVC